MAFDWRQYQFIPPWGMMAMFIAVAIYTLWTSNKINIIKNDLRQPRFLIVLLIIFAFLFLVKDPDISRSRYANDHAIIAGISAYFGHLDMPMMAVFLGGIYSYYTYRSTDLV
jgi:hypothetical protein